MSFVSLKKLKRLNNIIEIRRRLVNGEDNDTIIDALQLNRRTFYRLCKYAFDSDMKALEQQNIDALRKEMALLLERYNSIYRTLKAISEDSTISAEDRLGALGSMAQNAKARVELFMMSPALSIRQRRKLEALQTGSLYFGDIRVRLPPTWCQQSSSPYLPSSLPETEEELEQEQQEEKQEDIYDHEFSRHNSSERDN
jgi:hypothetical protein